VFFQPVVSSSAVPWQRFLTLKNLELHALRFYLHSLPCRTAFARSEPKTPFLTAAVVAESVYIVVA
jgi:hypothetical protein